MPRLPRKHANLTNVIVTTVVGAGFFVWLLVYTGQFPGTNRGYEVKAVVPTSVTLATGARVTMAGYRVGRVKSVGRRGLGALVTMRLTDDRVTPIPEDSTIAIRQRSALGENYVTITPGSSKKDLPDGSVLPVKRASEYVEVDQVLSTLQGGTRRRAQKLIQGLGGALDDRGLELRQLLGGTAGVFKGSSHAIDVADRHRREIPAMIEHMGEITAAVGARGEAIRQIARDGVRTFRAIGDEDEALQASLTKLPPTLNDVRALTGTLSTVSRSATPVVNNLGLAVADLRPTVGLLSPAARAGQRVFSALDGASPQLEKLLKQVRPLSAATDTALPNLQKTLCQVHPALNYIEPYIRDITATIANLGSSANAYDALGHLIKLAPIINDNTLVGLPDNVSKAAFDLIHTGFLSKQTSISYNPFPKPGQIGKEQAPETGQILGPTEYGKIYDYPRIKAAC